MVTSFDPAPGHLSVSADAQTLIYVNRDAGGTGQRLPIKPPAGTPAPGQDSHSSVMRE